MFQREVLYPKGDPNNPMTWDDVIKKFMTQCEPILAADTAREIVDRAAAIDKEPNVRSFAELLGRAGK